MIILTKLIIGLLAAAIASTSIFGYKVIDQYNDIKEIKYELVSIKLKNINLKEANFEAKFMINNPNKTIRISKINIDCYLEGICFTNYYELNKIIKEGRTLKALYPIKLDYINTGRGSLKSIVNAWEKNNYATFSYQVHYEMEFLKGVKTSLLLKVPIIKNKISDKITIDKSEKHKFEIYGMKWIKMVIDKITQTWEKRSVIMDTVINGIIKTWENIVDYD